MIVSMMDATIPNRVGVEEGRVVSKAHVLEVKELNQGAGLREIEKSSNHQGKEYYVSNMPPVEVVVVVVAD